MRFPELLWSLVNECESGAIAWSEDGDSVIFDYVKFKEEYMKDIKNFKTTNIASFVRQLNLYGFRKYQKANDKNGIKLHEFFHPMFIKGRQDLMNKMKRKPAYSPKKKFFSGSSRMQKDCVDKYPISMKDKKRPTKSKPETSSSEEHTSDDLPTPVRHIQPTSSMEEMRKFMFSNPLAGSNLSNKNMPDFSMPQSWMNTAFYHPGNWNRSVLGGMENLNRNFPGGFGSWNSNVPGGIENWGIPGGTGNWNSIPGGSENWNAPGGTENDENRLYSNLMRGYPVLKQGEGNAHYLIMPGYGPYGGMYSNPNFYMNTMPISGMPIKKKNQ